MTPLSENSHTIASSELSNTHVIRMDWFSRSGGKENNISIQSSNHRDSFVGDTRTIDAGYFVCLLHEFAPYLNYNSNVIRL